MATSNPSGPTLLIVSTSPADIRSYQEAAKLLELTPVLLERLDDVSASLDVSTPEAIVLDRLVGGENSMAFLAEWRERPDLETVPIIVVLEGNEPQDIYLAYDNGCDAAVQRPVDPAQLCSILDSMAE
jgi:DNA-binding response OmpR family regulator